MSEDVFMSFDYETARRHLERKTAELHKRDFLPGELVGFVGDISMRQLEAMREVALPKGFPAKVTPEEEFLTGKPLLAREEFPVDAALSRRLYDEFLKTCMELGGPLGKAAKAFAEGSGKDLDFEAATTAYLKGDAPFFTKWGEKTPDAPRLVAFLVQASLSPCLAVAADELQRFIPEDRVWNHGHCPACGSQPFMSSLRTKEGKRYSSCSFCSTDYRTPRIACAHCGERDHKKLVFYDIPAEPGYRIDVCESCRMYIKTADFRALDRISVPPLDDLESLPLDYLAVDKGFMRPTLSAWGF